MCKNRAAQNTIFNDRVPVKVDIDSLLLPCHQAQFFPGKIKTWFTAQRNRICQPKQEQDLFSPVAIIRQQWNNRSVCVAVSCKRETPLTEEAKKAKTGSDRNRIKTWVNGQAVTWCRALWWCIKVCYPIDMCYPSSPGLERVKNFELALCLLDKQTKPASSLK